MMQSRERNIVSTSAGGGFVRQRDDIAAVLGVPPAMVRVVSGDVGGNFGIRNSTCPGFALVACAARRVGRPVKWTCERRDAFASDFHGRDLSSKAELALDKDGHFLALRAINIGNLSTSAISFVPLAKGIAVSSSVYDIACSYKRGRAVVTNTVPTSAYRSAGRPEVVFVLERLIDIACRRHGFDRLEIKRRNLVPPKAMPYRNSLGLYDSGDYPASLWRAAELVQPGESCFAIAAIEDPGGAVYAFFENRYIPLSRAAAIPRPLSVRFFDGHYSRLLGVFRNQGGVIDFLT
jgi:aerobic carbon-monoxide dehydrogenase large subunit